MDPGRPPGGGAHFAQGRFPLWAKVAGPVAALVVVLIIVGVLVSSRSNKGTVSTSRSPATASTVAPPTPAPVTTARAAVPTTTSTTTAPTTTSTTTTSSMLLAPNGQPYEPGDLCRRSERGKTTTAGNGSTITCELVNGTDVWVRG
jgi:cell division protein FtsN